MLALAQLIRTRLLLEFPIASARLDDTEEDVERHAPRNHRKDQETCGRHVILLNHIDGSDLAVFLLVKIAGHFEIDRSASCKL